MASQRTFQFRDSPPPEGVQHLPTTMSSQSQGVQDWGSPPTQALGYPPAMGYPVEQSAYRALKEKESAATDRIYMSCLLLLISSLLFVTTLWTNFIKKHELRAIYPDFHIDSFSISDFNPSYPGFSASWEANITVRNSEEKLKIHFHQIHAFVQKYANVGYYDPFSTLASGFSQPFSMEPNTSNVIHAKLSTNDKYIARVGTESVGYDSKLTMGIRFLSKSRKEELAKAHSREVLNVLAYERSNDTLTVIFKLEIWTTFDGLSKGKYTEHTTLRLKCYAIEVVFIGDAEALRLFLLRWALKFTNTGFSVLLVCIVAVFGLTVKL